MEVKYFGGNCVKINYKKTNIIIDDVSKLTGKSLVTDKDIQVITDTRLVDANEKAKFVIDGPGEYGVSDVSVSGIAVKAHMDNDDSKLSTIYRIMLDDIRIGVIGSINSELGEEELEALGTIDLLFVPVGGNGYTLDPVGAKKVINKVEPKIVVPVHYDDKGLKYEVPQRSLDEALKELSMEPADRVDSLKLKVSDFGETTKLIVINIK